jgi:hypothetical protein
MRSVFRSSLSNTLSAAVDWRTSNNTPFELLRYPDSRQAFQATRRPHDNRSTHDYGMRVLLGT